LSRHEHYKQLCVLASLGELPADEGRKLRRHLADCEQCGQAYSDYLALRVGLIPHSDDAGTIAALKESTRAAVLHGIVDLEQRGTASPRKPETGVARPLWNQTLPLFGSAVALAAVAVCCFWLGMRYQSLRNVASAGRLQIQIPAVPAPTPATQSESTETSVRQEQFSKAFHREHEHNVQLRAALEEKENHLLATEEQNATLQHRIAVETKELSATESLLWSKSGELKQLQETQSSDKITMIALQYQGQELTDKLNSQNANLQREHDLLAKGREIRDIIGARNLHIVDVYDTDAKGRTKRPFARAFYTEGRSLVFYAYDLPLQRADGKPTYVAWGQRNGNKSSIRNLGILVNDDRGQKRWLLDFNDPNVLAEIDSVFITLEPSGDAERPSGKRMLTAYLKDEVNHP